jgi:hypothetical protein
VSLTHEGRIKIQHLFPRFNAEEAAIAGSLSPMEQDQLAGLLRTVARSVGSA